MIGKEQIEQIVNAIENTYVDEVVVKMSTDDYNNIAYIGEQLERIATALEKNK